MDDFKKLINREVNKENEWRCMNEFIVKLKGLMEFYDDLAKLREIENKCYKENPVVQLSQIDDIIYKEDTSFPLAEFESTIQILNNNIQN